MYSKDVHCSPLTGTWTDSTLAIFASPLSPSPLSPLPVLPTFPSQYLDKDGAQLEAPDPWLSNQNAWEIPRLDVTVRVRLYGEAERVGGSKGKAVWKGGREVLAVAYDVPIPGHKTRNTANIRFWSAQPISGFDLRSFDAGNYHASVESVQSAETITRVLYPNDNTDAGKELRLTQQYFWTAASLSDILRRYRKQERPWSELPEHVAIQLNDTHPTLAIPELVRILVDEEDVEFDVAWSIVQKVYVPLSPSTSRSCPSPWLTPYSAFFLFQLLVHQPHCPPRGAREVGRAPHEQSTPANHAGSYPSHPRSRASRATVLTHVLSLSGLQIIFDLNHDFMAVVDKLHPGDMGKMERMSLIQEGYPQSVRMANLAVVGSHKVGRQSRSSHSGPIFTSLTLFSIRFSSGQRSRRAAL